MYKDWQLLLFMNGRKYNTQYGRINKLEQVFAVPQPLHQIPGGSIRLIQNAGLDFAGSASTTQMLCLTRGTTRNGSAAICSTMANPAEKGPPFPSGGINLASPGLHLWPLDWSLQISPGG